MGSPITTHVLDTARGGPAPGIPVTLEREVDGAFDKIGGGVTNNDGRVADLTDAATFTAGTYRITFATQAYFDALGIDGFYPYASIVFRITAPDEHYHVPLLLSPYGYQTYRGS